MDLFIQSREKIKAWLLPYTNTQLFNRVLADFAHEFQLNRNKRVLLVLDQAGWHISHQLKLPEGLDLFFLPAHSPECDANASDRLKDGTGRECVRTRRAIVAINKRSYRQSYSANAM